MMTAKPSIGKTELDQKISADSFVVYYQPQVELKTNSVIGAEALVRGINDKGQIISPNDFIPYYEASGLIRELDFFVLKSVCLDIKHWESLGFHPCISVNFSRVTLMETHVVKRIKEVCKAHEVDPSRIMIEVTESVEKIDDAQLYLLMDELSQTGFRVSLDDFGAEYSNLSLLIERHFDEIKLDKSLIENLVSNKRSRIVVKSIAKMCKELGEERLLVEGIETKEQKQKLTQYKYKYGQGFYFYRPMIQEKFTRVLQRIGEANV